MNSVLQSRPLPIRIADSAAESWLWSNAPCSWRGRVNIDLRSIDFDLLEPAKTLKHWDVLALWTRQIACRRQIPPLIVSLTERGTYYIHDGNHRFEAIRVCYRNHLKRLRLRVAVLKPKPGFAFEPRSFATHWTYQLAPCEVEEPARQQEYAIARWKTHDSIKLLNLLKMSAASTGS
jgi:hypothetical protein